MSRTPQVLSPLVAALLLPGCLWVSDAEVAARLQGKQTVIVLNGGIEIPGTPDGDTGGFSDTGDGGDTTDTSGTTEESWTDRDGDGVPAGEDCDDRDPDRAPGLEEVCDGMDNDCDGQVDNDAADATIWYLDADGDGAGDPATAGSACTPPADHVDGVELDCDDDNPWIYPGAIEVLGDNIDQNCDGAFGPVAEPLPALSGTGLAPVALEPASRDGSVAVVLAWMSVDCGSATSPHLCGGTLDWSPGNGERWTDAASDLWDRPELQPDTLLSFSYAEGSSALWSWISESGSDREAHFEERTPGGSFDSTASWMLDWTDSSGADARVSAQSYERNGEVSLRAMACDASQGLLYSRHASGESVAYTDRWDYAHRVGDCSISQDFEEPMMVEVDDTAELVAWSTAGGTPVPTPFAPIQMVGASTVGGIGVHGVLGTEALVLQLCDTRNTATRCEESVSFSVAGAAQAQIDRNTGTGEVFACIVHEDGLASVLRIPDVRTGTADSWEVEGVSGVVSCDVVSDRHGDVVVALNTASEVYVAQAPLAVGR